VLDKNTNTNIKQWLNRAHDRERTKVRKLSEAIQLVRQKAQGTMETDRSRCQQQGNWNSIEWNCI